jgi:tetratricopeptide (TPR) repeat protein
LAPASGNSDTNKPNRQPESRVKRTGVSVFGVIFFYVAALAAQNSSIDSGSASLPPSTTQPINTIQLMAWLTAGISENRLVRLVHERGLAWTPNPEELHELESAGADAKVVRVLTTQKPVDPAHNLQRTARVEIPAALIQAATEARQQHYHEAARDLRQALASDPSNAALHFALGAMLRQQELWDDAYDEILQSAKLMPDLPENHGTLAYIFYRLDDGPNAIAEARTALSMDPQNAEAYQFLGLGLYSGGQYAAAAHAFAESLARDGDDADTYYDLGITLHADGNFPAALGAYRQAVHLEPTFWQAHSNLALTLHEEGKLDEAIAEYREAKRLAPEEASVRNNLGNTYCDHGDFDAAIAEFHELYRLHPEWQQGRGCLAQAYMAKKDYGSAIEELNRAVLQNPSGAAEHRVLGEALLLHGKPDEAVHELRLAVTLNPDSDASHHYLGTALFQQQQLQDAEKEFREALRLNASADNHYSLAACLMSMDRYEEAMSELETAARLDPERKLYRARRDELRKLMKESTAR